MGLTLAEPQEEHNELFKANKDGVPEYCGPLDKSEVVGYWRDLDSRIDSGIWAQAAIAFKIKPKYGDRDFEEFAEAVEKTPQYIRKIAKTYQHFTQKESRVSGLSFKHHTLSLQCKRPRKALLLAAERGWGCVKFLEWIYEQKETRRVAARRNANEFRDFLEIVDKTLLNWVDTCPNREWGRRVFNGWRQDVDWELDQIEKTETSEKVADAVAEGALTIPDIKAMTGLTVKQIEDAVTAKVSIGEWDWVREGGETEVARGTRRAIIHVVGTPVFH